MLMISAILADSVNSDVEKNVAELANWFEKFKEGAVKFGLRIIVALIFYAIGKKLIKWLKKILNRSFERSNMDEGVQKFLISFISISLNVVLIVAAINILSVVTTSLAAVIGSLGLTIGLALQGSLSNFAGGVLILIMKPFRIGDYIVANGMEGCVTSIDIFYTRLLTIDNRKVVIPNGGLSNSSIVNVTNEDLRRLDLMIPVSYDCDIKTVKHILMGVIEQEDFVLKEEPISICVNSFEDSSISMAVRVWTKKEDYWELKWDMLERIKDTFDKNHISIPFNQLDVNIKNEGIN
ncbi:MAG: mechanosensitive ion channel family protein [Velocimicrobium sp.]